MTPVVAAGCKARRVRRRGRGRTSRRPAQSACAGSARHAGTPRGDSAQSRLPWPFAALSDAAGAARHLMDGCVSAQFDGGTYKTTTGEPARSANAITIAVPPGQDAAAVAAAVERGVLTAESAIVTRSLANEPSNVLTPEEFANRVSAAASGRRPRR